MAWEFDSGLPVGEEGLVWKTPDFRQSVKREVGPSAKPHWLVQVLPLIKWISISRYKSRYCSILVWSGARSEEDEARDEDEE